MSYSSRGTDDSVMWRMGSTRLGGARELECLSLMVDYENDGGVRRGGRRRERRWWEEGSGGGGGGRKGREGGIREDPSLSADTHNNQIDHAINCKEGCWGPPSSLPLATQRGYGRLFYAENAPIQGDCLHGE
jgi:hypothetical protein